jgi:hypothetical protein
MNQMLRTLVVTALLMTAVGASSLARADEAAGNRLIKAMSD